MKNLDQLLDFYTRLIGMNGEGDQGLDRDLSVYAGFDLPTNFTGSVDQAIMWMEVALPDWQIHTMHHGVELWNCGLINGEATNEHSEGEGRSPAIAILAATVVALISNQLVHWNLEPRAETYHDELEEILDK